MVKFRKNIYLLQLGGIFVLYGASLAHKVSELITELDPLLGVG